MCQTITKYSSWLVAARANLQLFLSTWYRGQEQPTTLLLVNYNASFIFLVNSYSIFLRKIIKQINYFCPIIMYDFYCALLQLPMVVSCQVCVGVFDCVSRTKSKPKWGLLYWDLIILEVKVFDGVEQSYLLQLGW